MKIKNQKWFPVSAGGFRGNIETGKLLLPF